MLTVRLPEAVVFLLITALLGVENRMHLYGVEPVSWEWIIFLLCFVCLFVFSPRCSLQVGMVISWGSQKSRGLVISVVVIDYKFCHGEGDTSMPGKLSGEKA